MKSITAYPVAPPPGKVTEEKVTYLPTAKPWEVLFIVTVALLFVDVKVAPDMAVAKGDMS